METFKNSQDLKNAIQILEEKQAVEWVLLQEQIKLTSENLKPFNVLKKTIQSLGSTVDLKGDTLNAVLGLGAGFVAKRMTVGTPVNPLLKIIGAIIERVVSSKVSQNADSIKSVVGNLLTRRGSKQEANTDKE